MFHVHSFPPVETPDARVLVLGTMPGKMSLHAQQYYAHPRNSFWRIAGEILGFEAGSVYEHRVSSLAASGVALWDVLQSCSRGGSLDSAIDRDSMIFNDFAAFFARHRAIHRVCFNGAKAESLYLRHIQPLVASTTEVEYLRLPSTSPAHAGKSFLEKLGAWSAISPNERLPGHPFSHFTTTTF